MSAPESVNIYGIAELLSKIRVHPADQHMIIEAVTKLAHIGGCISACQELAAISFAMHKAGDPNAADAFFDVLLGVDCSMPQEGTV